MNERKILISLINSLSEDDCKLFLEFLTKGYPELIKCLDQYHKEVNNLIKTLNFSQS
jgi:hypothetical protein